MHPIVAKFWLRVRYAGRATARAMTSAAASLLAPIGFRETLLLGGAILIGAGIWPVSVPWALIIPGGIFIYVAIFGVN
jgi:hypothetical protein